MATAPANGQRADLYELGTTTLVKQLSHQVSTLVHQEVELAKAEVTEKSREAGVGAAFLAGAGVAGLLMLGSLTAFGIIALAQAMPAWVAALLITAVWAGVAAPLALRGLARMRAMGSPVPEKTIETLKEDVRWLKDRN